jgi:hypothetical protein
MQPDTATTIEQFNRAFVTHDPSLLRALVAQSCVMESVEPAPLGTRYEGSVSCLAFWEALAADTASQFSPEDIWVGEDRAIIR